MKEKLDDKSQFKKIVTDFRHSLSAMSELHAEFREYDDFYLAKHWNKQRATWRPDPVINYVSYVVDQKAPQLTNQRPAGIILPTAAGDEEAAKLFTTVTDVISERVDLDDKVDQVVRTGLLLGTAFFKVYWDNSLQGGSAEKGTIWKGDVTIDCPDPSNIYPDPSAISVDDCRYIIYAVPKATSWIEKVFGVKIEDADQSFETEIYNRPANNHSKDQVMFYEYWHKDKKGIHCIYAAGGKVLKRIDNVFKHGRYPFVSFVPKKNRKSLWGIGEPKNIMSNQKLLNKLVEMPTTHALLTANPIVLVQSNSGIDTKKWTNKPGQIWPVKSLNESAKFLEPPNFSNDVYKLTDMMQTFIERIGGVHEALTGETPNGVTAAAAIQMLQEQGSIPIKGIARNLYQSLKDVYELMIELVKENYTETRYLRITDEDGSMRFEPFNATEFAELDLDVKVSAGASTPTSKAYVAQLASELFEKGLLLGSEYVEMQEGLPNKERIVTRLRELEANPPQPPQVPGQIPTAPGMEQAPPMEMPMEAPMPQAQDLGSFYEGAPPELKQEIDLMLEQGLPEEEIMTRLLQQ